MKVQHYMASDMDGHLPVQEMRVRHSLTQVNWPI